MSLFRLVAAILFLIGAIIIAVDANIKEPMFWLLSGLAAYMVSGSKPDQTIG